MVPNKAKRVENASGTLHCCWHSVRTESTSGVYKRCKQTVSSTIVLLSDSYVLVIFIQCIWKYFLERQIL